MASDLEDYRRVLNRLIDTIQSDDEIMLTKRVADALKLASQDLQCLDGLRPEPKMEIVRDAVYSLRHGGSWQLPTIWDHRPQHDVIRRPGWWRWRHWLFEIDTDQNWYRFAFGPATLLVAIGRRRK